MKNDKFRLVIIGLLTISLLAGIAVYGYMIFSKNEVNTGGLLAIIIPLLLVVFMTFFIARRYKDIKQGIPMEDERSRKVLTQAAARTFFISLYWLLAISFFEDFFAGIAGLEKLDASNTIGLAIAGMSVVFFVSWLYYDKKGKLV